LTIYAGTRSHYFVTDHRGTGPDGRRPAQAADERIRALEQQVETLASRVAELETRLEGDRAGRPAPAPDLPFTTLGW
jgi:hypothetical protein